MELRINHYKSGERTDEHWATHSLEGAKDILCRWVREGVTDRIEIRNAADELLFRYPLLSPSA